MGSRERGEQEKEREEEDHYLFEGVNLAKESFLP